MVEYQLGSGGSPGSAGSGPGELDRIFAALADPTRRAILARLQGGDATVGELAAPFEMSFAAVSKHLGVLERAGLVERESRGRERRCRLEPAPLRAASEWTEAYRRFWEERLDALESLLRRGGKSGEVKGAKRAGAGKRTGRNAKKAGKRSGSRRK